MLYICDKNKDLIDALNKLDLSDSKIEMTFVHGDVIELHEKTPNSRIVTASNPDFNPAGGLDAVLAEKYEWENCKEFSWTDDLFYVVSVNKNIKSSKEIIQRALVGVYGYSYKFDLILTGIGTGIGGFSIDEFVELIANLCEADLCGADLRGANLRGADLRGADLYKTNFYEANLCEANLRGADLRGAKNLETVIYNENTAFLALQCPEEGNFIGWKKAKDNAIIKLLIPEDAKRSSATTRKCRCSHAQVLAIWDKDGKEVQEVLTAYSESRLIYKVGETIKCEKPFDENRWIECSSGIHFFITRREAELYN